MEGEKRGRPTLKIGISGVRGIAGESLTPRLAASFAAAFGTWSGPGPVVLGTDTRPSREMIVQAAAAGLLSVGRAPVVLGIVPVPALQFHVKSSVAAGGICVTAGHNPAEWNALKFFGGDGVMLRPNQVAELTDLYHQGVYPRARAAGIPDIVEDPNSAARHREAVIAAVDAAAIRVRRVKAVVDCCNGAAYAAAPAFLEALGCDVLPLNAEGSGLFPRDPEPTAENIGALCGAVRDSGAEVGFALDADGDRLAVVDERGEALGEECTLALAVDRFLRRVKGPVVINLSTSRMVEEIAESFGCPVLRTKVGEINVLERMLEAGSPIGGEGNGGVIVPAVNPCRDGFTAMALVLEALAAEKTTVSGLRERLPRYAMVKEKLPCRRRFVAPCLRLVRFHNRGGEMDLTDGVKVLRPDRWLHVRPSNTEPVIRITAEAPTEDAARELVEEALEYLRPACG